MKIQVGVMSEDANGAPDVTFHTIECSQEQYDNGDHYDMAKDLAEEDGYEPKIAFDENDPAWRAFQPANSVYKTLYLEMLQTCQAAVIGDQDCPGADFVNDVAHTLVAHLKNALPEAGEDPRFYFVLGPDGYNGGCGDLLDVVLQTNPESLALDCAPPAAVIGLTRAQVNLFLRSGMTAISELRDCASEAVKRGEKYGFAISEANAAEVMREELAVSDLPTELDPALAAIMLSVVETQSNPARELG